MRYRIRIDLAFPNKPDADNLLPLLRDAFRFAVPINPGTKYYEETGIEISKCYHDENPQRPCEILAKFVIV